MLWEQGGGSSQRLAIELPSASWDTEDGAARQGTSGSTLAAAYVLVPGTDPADSRYFWFSHADANGVQTGPDPGDWDTALSGITGIEVVLPAGEIPAGLVAQALDIAAVADGTFTVDSRVGGTVTLSGPMNAAAASMGDTYDDRGEQDPTLPGTGTDPLRRGPGGIWGFNYYDAATLAGAGFGLGGECRFARFDPADIPAAIFRITAIEFNRSDAVNQNVRMALFEGGTSDTNPIGAVQIADLGIVGGTPATGVGVMNGWTRQVLEAANVFEVDGNTVGRLWLAFKGNGGVLIRSVGTASAIGDFASTPGIWRSGSMDGDPANAFEAVVPSGSPGSFSFLPCARLVIQLQNAAGNYGSDGSWSRIIGTPRNDLATAPSSVTIGVMVGNTFQVPPVSEMEIAWVDAGYRAVNAAELWRLGIYGDLTSITDPNNGSLIWDAGQSPNPGGPDLYGRIFASSPRPQIPASDQIWVGLRGNNNLSRIAFGTPLNWSGSNIDPINGSNEFGGYEYEITATAGVSNNPNLSVDETVPYEATFLTDASDIQPGNHPSERIRLEKAGITLTPNP